MVLFSTLIILAYLFLIGSFVWGFGKVKPFYLRNLPAKTTFSVIIPFRNEADNLPELLKSIKGLKYPKHLFEIIFVDDDSNDDSVEVIKKELGTFSSEVNIQLEVKIIKNERHSNAPKKDAITAAIKQAKNDWIITTDGDCVLPKYWLDSFDEFIQQTYSKCIVAPVTYLDVNSFLKRFQLLDVLSLQGSTMGSFGIKKPFMCNGANFGYKKSAFAALNGFEGNTHIASGDDIFFLEKVIGAYPKSVNYLKCEQAIVTTKSQPSWPLLIEQRLRWAAKASAYKNKFGTLTGFLVLLANALVLATALFTALGMFKLKTLVYILFIKFNIDFLLIYKTAVFFDKKHVLISYVTAFLVYPFFSIYIAFLSMFKTYKWKNRTFKR